MSADRPLREVARPSRRREVSRQIVEELERIRQSEAKVAEALGAMRGARERVEELTRLLTADERRMRELVREELEARSPGGEGGLQDEREVGGVAALFSETGAASGPAGNGDGDEEGATAASVAPEAEESREEGRRGLRLVAVVAASVITVAGVGWLAWRTFQGPRESETLTLAGGPVEEERLPGMPAPETVEQDDPQEELREQAERFFVTLPKDASLRAAVYDSLWQARSPLFDPLLEEVREATDEGAVERSLVAWASDAPLAPLEDDLLRNALVQYVLREEMGGELAVDGQLLRNPCRGNSCSALLNLWETRGQAYGLPPVPDDAPRNPTALRVGENVIVLDWLSETHGVSAQRS